MENRAGLVGDGEFVEVTKLSLDRTNPRFPVDVAENDQAAIAREMADRYDAIEIARRIAMEGFHVAEPPAVVIEDGAYVVVEGNRRVTALKGLADGDLRSNFADAPEWEKLATIADRESRVPTVIPVIVYPSRKAAKPLLGQRHIRGQLRWEPLQQARFIDGLVSDGMSFDEAAQVCNLKVGEVRSMYRNYRLVSVDAPALKVPTAEIDKKFTVLGNVLDNKTLREHAHVIPDSEVKVGQSSLSSSDTSAVTDLRELLGWVLGDGKKAPVLTESRRIVKLGQAVAAPAGLAALRSGKTLDEALQIVSDLGAAPLEAATRMMTTAANALSLAREQVAKLDDAEKSSLAELAAKLGAAHEALKTELA